METYRWVTVFPLNNASWRYTLICQWFRVFSEIGSGGVLSSFQLMACTKLCSLPFQPAAVSSNPIEHYEKIVTAENKFTPVTIDGTYSNCQIIQSASKIISQPRQQFIWFTEIDRKEKPEFPDRGVLNNWGSPEQRMQHLISSCCQGNKPTDSHHATVTIWICIQQSFGVSQP